MRRIVLSEMVSLDGFAAGPKGEFDWPLADEEFEERANELLDASDTLLLGRKTYEMFASYWPTAAPSPTGRMVESTGVEFTVPTAPTKAHEEVARKMNSYRKVVFSRTLDRVEWANSTLMREVIPGEIDEMKRKDGKDMFLLGSIDLARSFARLGLIDEYRLWVNPVILGNGMAIMGGLDRRRLKFVGTKTFGSGLVELRYTQV